jgi:hypothetical protein
MTRNLDRAHISIGDHGEQTSRTRTLPDRSSSEPPIIGGRPTLGDARSVLEAAGRRNSPSELPRAKILRRELGAKRLRSSEWSLATIVGL